MNTVNLLKLADFLENEITDEQFDMTDYRTDEKGRYARFIDKTNCGTIGCALGWAPFVKGLENKHQEFRTFSASLDWTIYCARVFNVGSHIWEFIFDFLWSKIPEENTRHATANRIRIACEGLIR